MMKSKYIDIAFIIFMGYFAYNRFMNDQTGIAILFVVLCLMNVLTFIMKTRQAKTETKSKPM
ncbi:hypothetical protein FITA111629_06200 [Filibacter tadaridae]|uniref:Uncharacterized protein n=1 Tax=Filibacter tadaridae TaxID=2483811 RepID=A0A3P5XFM4_9BACL|nr:hypothetical protein [Filibacter tadaridae]VDC33551.1 hypothetical protein FILTAD_02961 [Filibacter tadaridae]